MGHARHKVQEDALASLADRATVPVDLRVALSSERLPVAVEAARRAEPGSRWSAATAISTSRWATTGVGGADFHSGSGLQGLRDRVAAVGGVLQMASRPGTGTVLRAQLPVDVQQS